jgi:hypothetical protein
VRVRLYDDRLELLLGATLLMTLQRGRSGANGKHGQIVDLPPSPQKISPIVGVIY